MKLKAKFILIISSLMIAIFASTAFFAFSRYKESIKNIVSQQQFLMISIFADEIDNRLLTAQQHLVEFGKTIPVDIIKNPDKSRVAQALLDSKQDLHLIFDNHLFLFSSEGKIFVESPYVPSRRGLDLSFRDYIKKTIQTNKAYISDPFISSQPNKHPVIALTVPVFDSKGKLDGILAGGIDLMKTNFMERISTVKVGKEGNFYLYATDGTMIMHPNKKRILVKQPRGLNKLYDMAEDGFEGTGETTTSYGLKAVTSFKRLKTKNWILAANYPQAEAYLPIRNAEKYFLMATASGITAIFLITFFIIRRMTDPLEVFTRHVQDIGQKKGDERFLNINTKDEIGTLSRAFNTMIAKIDHDIAERKEAEDRIIESEHKFKSVAEQSLTGIYLIQDGVFKYVNPKFAEIFGYTIEECLNGMPFDKLVHPQYLQKVKEQVNRRITGTDKTSHYEFNGVKKTGEIINVEIHGSRGTYNKKPAAIGTLLDISERKKMEEELLKSRKLESIAILSKGIAHDFNNLLTSVLGFVSLSKTLVPPSEQTHKYLTFAESACVKAKDLISQLDNFASGLKLEKRGSSLVPLLQDSTGLLSKNANIKVNISIPDNLWSAEIDGRQISQVMYELLENAGEAIPNGGVIDIAAKNTVVSGSNLFPLQEGHYIKISVKDQGVGIAKENLSNIFEPYFTTKQMDYKSGVGLGLALCYSIVKGHKGYIVVDSELGKGTVVDVYLPASPENNEQTDLPPIQTT